MITKMPITPDAYKAYWKTLAEKHVNVKHDDEASPRFVIINETMINPWKGIDMGELIKKQRSVLKYGNTDPSNQKLLMVLTEYAADIKNIQIRPQQAVDGAVLILGKVTENDYDSRDRVMQLAHATCQDLANWTRKFFEVNGRLNNLDNLQMDPVGPISPDNLYGYRLDFGWTIHTNYSYETENFDNFEPPTL